MKQMIFLAVSYLKYYKRQTAVVFLGVVLSSALFAGMGGLLESGRKTVLENARSEYGDWHYSTRGEGNWFKEFEENPDGDGYILEASGVETVKKMIEEPFALSFVYADEGYLDMMGRRMTEGHYPKEKNEIALDRQTLHNLKIEGKLGSSVTLDGESFILCGIVADMPEKLLQQSGDCRQAFVSRASGYGQDGTFLYLKFDEGRSVYRQMSAFCDRFGVNKERVARNNGIGGYVDAEPESSIAEIIREGISHGEAGLPYIWGQLNEGGDLTMKVILCSLMLFGAFIIYSIFQFSVIRRMSQYSMMQTMGVTDGCVFAILLLELGSVCLAGYPIGCAAGNLIAWAIYQRAGRIFIVQKQVYHTGASDEMQEYAASHLPDPGSYQVNWHIMFLGGLFLLFVIAVISFCLIRRMRRLTVHQMMVKEVKKHVNRKIYSTGHGSMTGILTRKFMFDRKGTFAGIIVSLSLCSVFFLGVYYVTENTRINNELVYKADDGLGSDIQVYDSGIAAILFGISMLHITNSMQYLVFARRREFGILRAMGITEGGFLKMLAKEGIRYGVCSDLAVFAGYLILQKVLYYFLVHVYLYLHPGSFISLWALSGVILLNIVLCVGVILLSGKSVLKLQVIDAIRE